MARKPPDRPSVSRRPRAERRRLAPEFEPLVRGEKAGRAKGPRPGPRLRDPRTTFLLPGVANRDARFMAQSRVERMVSEARALAAGDGAPLLGLMLAEAVDLGLWRGLNVMGFEALVEHVLGMDLRAAQKLLREAERERGAEASRLSDEAIAAWVRTEVALLETEPNARAWVTRAADGQEILHLEVPVAGASRALFAAGGKHAVLARDQAQRPPRRNAR